MPPVLRFSCVLFAVLFVFMAQAASHSCSTWRVAGAQNYAPHIYWNPELAQYEGKLADITQQVATAMEVELIHVSVTPWSRALKALELGQLDMIAMYHTSQRARFYRFSQGLYSLSYRFFTRTALASKYRELKALKGHRVDILPAESVGDALDKYIHQHMQVFEIPDAVKSLHRITKGWTDFILMDGELGQHLIAKHGYTQRIVKTEISSESNSVRFAFSLRSACSKRVSEVDNTLNKLGF